MNSVSVCFIYLWTESPFGTYRSQVQILSSRPLNSRFFLYQTPRVQIRCRFSGAAFAPTETRVPRTFWSSLEKTDGAGAPSLHSCRPRTHDVDATFDEIIDVAGGKDRPFGASYSRYHGVELADGLARNFSRSSDLGEHLSGILIETEDVICEVFC